jgi:hypothetical protein
MAVFLLFVGVATLVWTFYRVGQDAAVMGNVYAIRKLVQQRLPASLCEVTWAEVGEAELARYFPDGRGVIYDCSWDQVISAGRIPDVWGTPIRVWHGINSKGKCDYIVVSAGFDRQFGTNDDIDAGE